MLSVRGMMGLGMALLGVSGCRGKTPVDDLQIALRINGQVISRQSFERELLREMQALDGTVPQTPEQIEPFKKTLVETLIDRTLLLQAAQEANVVATPEEIDRRIMGMSADFANDGLESTLQEHHSSKEEFKRQTSEQITIEKLLHAQVYARIAVKESELLDFFEKNRDRFAQQEKVRVSQIFLTGLDDAKRALQTVRSGAKFADVARRMSQAPEAKWGGDMGWISRDVLPQELDEIIFTLPVQRVSEVVATQYGYHVLLVTERQPAKALEFAEAKSQVEKHLVARLRQQAQDAYLKQLREKATIRVNSDALVLVTGKKS